MNCLKYIITTVKKLPNRHFWLSFLFGLASVFFIFLYHFNWSMIIPTNIHWLMQGDCATHYLGWLFFRNEVWTFPLGEIKNYIYPLGTNIGYTDSIPLLAFVFKLFSGLLPADFQYFGLWLLSCFVLQALFGALIFKNFKCSLIVKIIGVQFLVFSPILLFRSIHPALCAHWLILAGIYLYLSDTKPGEIKKIITYHFIILVLALFIHPYIVIMVWLLMLAHLVKLTFFDKHIRKKINFSIILVFSLLIIFAIWIAIGYFTLGNAYDYGASGFGYYSFNLNGLLNSANLSTFFRQLPTVYPGQLTEGFNYLGFGLIIIVLTVLLVLVYKIVIANKYLPQIQWKRLWPLVVINILLFVFSLSNVITVNDHVLFYYPLSDFFIVMLSPFRSSGRFFWITYYSIMIFAIFALSNQLKKRARIVASILLVALFFQIVDISPLLIKWKIRHQQYEMIINEAKWTELINKFDNVVIYPAFQKNYVRDDDYMSFAYIAAKNHKTINAGYVARADRKKIDDETAKLSMKITKAELDKDSLYITTEKYLLIFLPLLSQNKIECIHLDCFYACNTKE
ncbi:MAG: DUF6311 domain-containing protein [bacterium]